MDLRATERTRRTRRATMAAALMAVLLPGVALAAVPVAVDDPGVPCGSTDQFGGSYPIPEDRKGTPDVFFAGDQGLWAPFFGHCSLLYNDTDADGDPLTYQIVTPPAHGQVMKIDDEWTAYKPDPDYSTRAGDIPGGDWVSDSFTYKACDATDCSAPATMRIWIAEVNDVPTFTPGPTTIVVDEDSGTSTTQWATNISPGPPSESYQQVHFELDGPAGFWSLPADLLTGPPTISPDGVLSFTPRPNMAGHAHITLVAKDDGGGIETWPNWKGQTLKAPDDTTDQVEVEIYVTPVDDAIVAVDDTYTIDEDSGPNDLDLFANDSNLDGGPLSISAHTQPTLGTLALEPGGVSYTPDPDANGTDTFTYTLTGGSSATVTVHITPADEPADTTPPTVNAPTVRLIGQTVGTSTTMVNVAWTGADPGSGVHDYKLQMSTKGGSFKTVKLASATATSAAVSLSTGSTYRFRVRAADKAGNTSTYAYTATSALLRSGETSSAVAYVGTWTTSTTKNALGGTARYASSPSKSATYTFTGTDVGWIATRTTSSGHARVFIDGVLVGTVDLDRSKTRYRQLVVARHLDSGGLHTMRIEPVGDGRVDIDGFAILR